MHRVRDINVEEVAVAAWPALCLRRRSRWGRPLRPRRANRILMAFWEKGSAAYSANRRELRFIDGGVKLFRCELAGGWDCCGVSTGAGKNLDVIGTVMRELWTKRRTSHGMSAMRNRRAQGRGNVRCETSPSRRRRCNGHIRAATNIGGPGIRRG